MSRFVVFVAIVGALIMSPAARPAAADPASAEAEFVQRINALRADKGLAPLGVDPELTAIARRWSARMADDGELSHNPNLGNEARDWRMLGENVGVGPTVESIHRAFVNSPRHYENLVEPAFTLIGVGVVERDGQIWVTQDFKQPRAARAAPAPAPAPRPAPAAAPAHAPRPPRPAPVRATRAAPAPAPTAPPTTVPAPPPTTTTSTSTTTSTVASEVAGAQFNKPGDGGPAKGLVDGASAFLVGGLLLAAMRPALAVMRNRA